MTTSAREELRADGYTVRRARFEPAPLLAEFLAVDADAFADPAHRNHGAGGNAFRYVPVMRERTPVSNALVRRQWRTDFVADDGEDAALRTYFAGQFRRGWDGGYDADRYPSFGPASQWARPRWTARLDALGVLTAAQEEESSRG